MYQMKNFPLCFILLLALTIISCKNDDELLVLPSKAVTTYTGTLSYTSSTGEVITNNTNATASIQLNEVNYNIVFSDNVPAINGIVFKATDTGYSTVLGSAFTGISVEGDELRVGSVDDGNVWAFTGSK